MAIKLFPHNGNNGIFQHIQAKQIFVEQIKIEKYRGNIGENEYEENTK